MSLAELLATPPLRPTGPLPANDKRILVIDIERYAGLTHIFDQKQSGFIPVSQWVRLPGLLCFAAKWHGKKPIIFESAWNNRDAMIQRSWQLYDEADIVVTYNGVSFDNKHLRDEWLLAGFTQPRPWKNVDLYQINKREFGFESKSLNHLCERLGLPTKSGRYNARQADLCMDGDLKAQRLMKRYNIGDTRITEAAYDKLLPWITNHPHVGTGRVCNRCGSGKLTLDGSTRQAVVMEYALYRCDDCGSLVYGERLGRIASTRGV